MTTIVTRFAPSPTGHLHIGGARTAIFNWLLARASGGSFFLRIEDTDQARSTEENTRGILDSMAWLGLSHDGEIVYQSRRFDLYNQYIDRLLASGHAYYCSCTPDEVEAMREQARSRGQKPKYSGRCREKGLAPGPGAPAMVVRLKAPLSGSTVVHDLVKGDVAFDNAELDDMVLRRTDGSPTYNMAVVVDDATMGVTHIIRGDDHLNNTPRQILIYQALGLPLPVFGHVPMILGPDKKKLSKRHGATSVMEYEREGFLPEAMLNGLVRLGWSHGDQEIFSRQELVQAFSTDNLGSSAAVFDRDKLLWLNAHYIKETPDAALAAMLGDFLGRLGHPGADADYLARIVPLLKPRAQTMVEMAEKAVFFVVADGELAHDQKAVEKFFTSEAKGHLAALWELFKTVTPFDQPSLEAAVQGYLDATGVKFKLLAQPIRVAITGTTASPGLFETMDVLGRERVLARLERALAL
ncbi:glutamate--tRNA ligase [Desulfovibrio sulfodismutans]|uniref:Glutamate--tRNA ligase n=1 Tax=Desulfolutivibrio sulfodismutans TaxID=63561 RepID=A0A7K3NLY2_9BACT|nr:glutamate--tRNA ligase [Desulfolutivibrio sulfodismutans]NDY56843.1 glutamate--tRNA ligase [Desulfolutivibrio sulfodismutans]QLA13892.1 glutamate--tRNA ligase [Desulfolutivibrio sulfodismutans DSM 3696]